MTLGNLNELIKYWADLSDYDMVTAKSMYKTKRYPYCLFMCHLAIEKVLKSLVVNKIKNHAPYTHNLVNLAQKTGIELDDKFKELISDLTEFNLEARYPEWKKEFYKMATKAYVKKYLSETIKLQKWLKNYLKK